MADLPTKIGQQAVAAAADKTSSFAPLRPDPVRPHENRVLASLPQPDFALLARYLHVASLKLGAVLQHQGHPFDYVYFPHDGLVSLLAITPNGQIIEAASTGRGGAVYPVHNVREAFLTAVAQGTMRVSRIAAAQLEIARRESEAVNRALIACREALLFQLRQSVVCAPLHAVEQRLSRWLLEAADRLESNAIPILASQEELAQRLGVRRTTVTLLAGKLQDVGAIRWGRSRVEILDRARLEVMACSCYAALRERMSNLPSAEPTVARGLAD